MQTEILKLVVVHLVVQTAKQDQDPPDALRRLSDVLNAAIDLLPFGTGGPIADRYIEAHRNEIDQMIEAAQKLAGLPN